MGDLRGKSPSLDTRANLQLDIQDLQGFFGDSYDMAGKVKVTDIQASGTLSKLEGEFGLQLTAVQLNKLKLENLTTKSEVHARYVQPNGN